MSMGLLGVVKRRGYISASFKLGVVVVTTEFDIGQWRFGALLQPCVSYYSLDVLWLSVHIESLRGFLARKGLRAY